MNLSRIALLLLTLIVLAVTSGCAAPRVAMEHRNLEVHTKMSDSIFLAPNAEKTVFVDVKNTSDKQNFSIIEPLKGRLVAGGFKLVSNPEQAAYQIQVNVLQVGKGAPSARRAGSGFGSPIRGVVSGVATMAALSGHATGRQMGVAGLVAGAADFVAGSLVENVTYTVIADVQLSQRTSGGVQVQGTQSLAQGSSGVEKVVYQERSQYKRYRTRVFATANKMNLDWDDAAPAIKRSMAASLSGLL